MARSAALLVFFGHRWHGPGALLAAYSAAPQRPRHRPMGPLVGLQSKFDFQHYPEFSDKRHSVESRVAAAELSAAFVHSHSC
jgi:hypothetical protein